jgi:hypothetical protein
MRLRSHSHCRRRNPAPEGAALGGSDLGQRTWRVDDGCARLFALDDDHLACPLPSARAIHIAYIESLVNLQQAQHRRTFLNASPYRTHATSI